METLAEQPPLETDIHSRRPKLYLVPPPEELPQATSIAEIEADQMTREAAGLFAAQVLVGAEIKQPIISQVKSLKHGIQKAAKGDPEARAMVRANVATDAFERTMKVENVTEVMMEVEDDVVYQNGQTIESIQANSLLYASNHEAIERRTHAENRNSFRVKKHFQEGDLEDNLVFVASLVADDMSKSDLKQANFFLETMSASLQATTVKNGTLNTETAFVAGAKHENAPRHDIKTIIAVYKKLGVDIEGKSVTEILDTPLLIPKSLAPNGVIDLVRLYDDCAGGTFFGQDKPRKDYVSFRQECREREKTFDSKIDTITDELVGEASTIKTEIQAVKRLNKISGKHMVDRAIEDHTIDPRVFGEAAPDIIHARHQAQIGNFDMVEHYRKQARRKETSGSCPGSLKNEVDEFGNEIESDVYGFKRGSKSSDADCEFVSKECPKCHKKNVKTKSVKDSTGKVRYEGACGCKS